MITIQWLYVLVGLMFAGFAAFNGLDRTNPKRLGNAAFWGLMALSMFAGDRIGDFGNGLLVLGLAGIAGFGLVGRGAAVVDTQEREARALRFGDRLFLPALIVPATALLGTLIYSYTPVGRLGWFEPKRETYILLALGVILALATIYAWLKPPALAPLQDGRRLMDSIGWAAVLPQALAALGAVFAAAGVGDIVGAAATSVIPHGSVFLTVAVFGIGMALFTMIMGNAFAAFPVMAAAIGIPVLIRGYGANPAAVGAVGMLAGFCGTLMTPMAANFNLVPAALLELRDQNAVVKVQVATALPLLLFNIMLIYLAGFQ
ncbi:DUF979 domain-containing protein [Sphingomonas sp.]|uniref:DUF979 domain-containing protein n=1 Tax=Sphingomonas sp. TaxID=28214 RepID=UPI0025DE0ED0|nr:DUF979 domain-containing protein [Sphingomonas sp.]MBV9527034.1 DUF979 domain-containing protein [Sphingomonas sp.]